MPEFPTSTCASDSSSNDPGANAHCEQALETILANLRMALFPYYDNNGLFCWDCKETRTVIWLNQTVVEKAERMLKKIPVPFRIEENRALDEVIGALSSGLYKQNSWVRREVIDVYRVLQAHGYLYSVEAMTEEGLAGAVLGIDLRECFIVETMLTITGEASKAALCHLVKRLAQRGYPFIDVQRPHPPNHPCARLFEQTMAIDTYRALLARTLAQPAV